MATKKEIALELFNWWVPVNSPLYNIEERQKMSFLFESPSHEIAPQIRKIEAAYKLWGNEKCGMTAQEKSGMVWSNQRNEFIPVEESF